jgi:hypothetical protein
MRDGALVDRSRSRQKTKIQGELGSQAPGTEELFTEGHEGNQEEKSGLVQAEQISVTFVLLTLNFRNFARIPLWQNDPKDEHNCGCGYAALWSPVSNLFAFRVPASSTAARQVPR